MPQKRHFCRNCGTDLPEEGWCERCAPLKDLPRQAFPQEQMEKDGGIVIMGHSPNVPEHLHGRGFGYSQQLRPTEAQVLKVARRKLDIPEVGWVCIDVDRTRADEARWTFARFASEGEERPGIVAWLVCTDAMAGWRYDLRTDT
jgi:hypothetical protein